MRERETPAAAPNSSAAAPEGTDFESSPEIVQRTCPICGATLEERSCKLFCPRPACNYFLSCADYY